MIFAVELLGGVEVVVVVVEPRVRKPFGLSRLQQPERRAGLEPERLDGRDHLGDRLELRVLRAAVRRAHAEARRARVFRALGGRADLVERQQRMRVDVGLEANALRAVGAVLGAGAGLDRQQRGDLHRVRVEVLAMHPLRACSSRSLNGSAYSASTCATVQSCPRLRGHARASPISRSSADISCSR